MFTECKYVEYSFEKEKDLAINVKHIDNLIALSIQLKIILDISKKVQINSIMTNYQRFMKVLII